LKDAIAFAIDENNKVGDYNYFRSKTVYVPVDSMQVMREKVIAVKDTGRLVKNIKWTLSNQIHYKRKINGVRFNCA
jgi:hypothetical protein